MRCLPVAVIWLLSGICAAQAPVEPRTLAAMVGHASVTTEELGRPIAIGPDWECIEPDLTVGFIGATVTLAPGQRAVADFGVMGTVSVRFE